MSNELMDYTARDNFDFFTFWKSPYNGNSLETAKRTILINHCQGVIESAWKTVRDTYELAYRLKQLQENGQWVNIINPKTGFCFKINSFSEFCEYAFGFSQTMTSNLTRIAKFIKKGKDGAVGFIEAKYEKFKKSCLVELASVSEVYWEYFTSDMTVADIRLAKEYMLNGRFYIEHFDDNFDIKAYAQKYKAEKEAKKTETVTSAPSLDIIPGQISLDDMEEVQEQAPQAPAKSDVEFSDDRFAPPSAWLKYHPEDEDDGLDEAIYDKDDEPTSEPEEAEPDEDEPETFVQEEQPTGYSFQNRDAIRAFYGDYRNWEKNPATFIGIEAFEYKFRGKDVSIVALESITCKDIANLTAGRTVVRYFWRENRNGKLHAYEVSVLDLEEHIKKIKNELK